MKVMEITMTNKEYASCPTCQGEVICVNAFDAYACRACNRWFERACKDPNCTYCVKRPKHPNDVVNWDDPQNFRVLAKRFHPEKYDNA